MVELLFLPLQKKLMLSHSFFPPFLTHTVTHMHQYTVSLTLCFGSLAAVLSAVPPFHIFVSAGVWWCVVRALFLSVCACFVCFRQPVCVSMRVWTVSVGVWSCANDLPVAQTSVKCVEKERGRKRGRRERKMWKWRVLQHLIFGITDPSLPCCSFGETPQSPAPEQELGKSAWTAVMWNWWMERWKDK